MCPMLIVSTVAQIIQASANHGAQAIGPASRIYTSD